MKTQNMMDDFGNECAEVRTLPTGGGGNILCGRRGYDREMAFRRERIRAGVPFDLPAWESLAVYFPERVAYQPKTGQPCHCRRGQQRDNCPDCEGTGWRIDFAAIRARRATA